ncbi:MULTISPECIES: DUF3592 domain-containing protein [Actinokineospora]|uniref:DUF3592 domain-containing protein n=1 Tax=Actinokineospora fastidiosa TaxID=1816 RepID=A0A918LDW9_9PSEU|nr:MULTISPECIES: DUF3592 domain-containing protein [Actinokineospora]UVS80150.1 hypothetical protein Actkin_03900 [Actinokineospora sp. UTMC 2448]GGS33402.1 hypothetical protein GCM10010171_29470 [Actinokineospora fastidiosa]
MGGKLKSRGGRIVAALVLVGSVVGLVSVIRSATEQQSWASAPGVVQERIREGKSFSVKVAYRLPDGSEQVATLSENGPAREPGEQVTVRYDLADGKVVDAALADNDQAFWVGGVMLGVLVLGALFANLIVWAPRRRAD